MYLKTVNLINNSKKIFLYYFSIITFDQPRIIVRSQIRDQRYVSVSNSLKWERQENMAFRYVVTLMIQEMEILK